MSGAKLQQLCGEALWERKRRLVEEFYYDSSLFSYQRSSHAPSQSYRSVSLCIRVPDTKFIMILAPEITFILKLVEMDYVGKISWTFWFLPVAELISSNISFVRCEIYRIELTIEIWEKERISTSISPEWMGVHSNMWIYGIFFV